MATNRSRGKAAIERRSPTLGLALLSGAIAALVASPLLWIVLRAAQVEPVRGLNLLISGRTAEILLTSVGLMAVVTVLSTLIGVPLAVLTTRTDLPFRRVWTVIAALPLVIPSYIGAFAFVSMFGRHGEVGSILGVTPPQIDGFGGAAVIITLYTYPYIFLATRAALLSMNATLEEAARTLNSTWIDAFRRVTLPQIRPAIVAGALLVALYAVSDFGTPAFMRVEVFTSAIYWEYGAFNVEYAALLSMQLLAITAVILAIEARIGQEENTSGSADSGGLIRLGPWKWPAMAAIAVLGIVTLVVPVGIFGIWLVRGTGGDVPSLAFQWGHALNSVYLAGAAAIIATMLALPVGYFAAKSDSMAGRLFERMTYVGFAVPGIVIGLALVFFGAKYVPWIYRTIPLLVFAYVVRFIPLAVGITRTSVLQVDQQLIEAARTLNVGRLGAYRRVTVPLIAPGLIAGSALVFLTTMKELPATLMLQPIGMDTLVTIIWSAHESVHYRYAAIPALILVVISGLSMLILLRQEDFNYS